MASEMNRRAFLKDSILASAAGAMAIQSQTSGEEAKPAASQPASAPASAPAAKNALPTGKFNFLHVSRLILGGNLLTHFTHSRDLKYVYNLAAHYNTEAKILETLALAEENGINTMSVHNPPAILKILQKHRKLGGKMQWIICPTASVETGEDYLRQVQELADMGCDAIYVWGVRSDPLAGQGKVDMILKAVSIARNLGLPSGVGAHDLKVVQECEKRGVEPDFYIKTFHHHNYPSAPKPEQLKGPYSEVPGYWCRDPKETIETMKAVKKPWIAFKVMAAGAIPPKDAFQYAFNNGADHVLAGMFDFEIEQDVAFAREAIEKAKRERPWRS